MNDKEGGGNCILMMPFHEKHKSFSRPVIEWLNREFSAKTVLEIGAGTEPRMKNAITLDIKGSSTIMLLTDAWMLSMRSASIDLVFAFAVLEHVADLEGVVREMRRVLKEGGYLYAEIPFHQPYHPDDQHSYDDYVRLTKPGISRFFKSVFTEVKTGPTGHPRQAVTWSVARYVQLAFEDVPLLRKVLLGLAYTFFYLLRFRDNAITEKKAEYLTDGFFFLGRAKAVSEL